MTHPESVFFARVRRLAASEPVSGSVSAKQPSASPEQSRGSHSPLLLLRSPALDRAADERGLDRDDGAGGRVGAADLLDDQPVADVVEAAAAVLLGDRRSEVADLAELSRQLAVEAGGAVVVADPRDDLPVAELARALGDQALLVAELEVHQARGRGSRWIVGSRSGSRRRPRSPPRSAGPGASGSPRPSTAETGWTSRVVEARNASSAPTSSSSGYSPSSTCERADQPVAGDRGEDAGVRSTGCAARRRRATQKTVEVGASSTIPSGRTRTASSAPLRWRQPGRLHVRRVGERLDPGEDDRRGVVDRRQRDGLGVRRQLLGEGEPAPAAGDDQAELAVVLAEALRAGRRSRPRAPARSTGSSIAAAERSRRSRCSSSANGRPP